MITDSYSYVSCLKQSEIYEWVKLVCVRKVELQELIPAFGGKIVKEV